MEQHIKAILLDSLLKNKRLQEEYPQILQAIQNTYNELCLQYIFKETILQ